MLEKCKKPADNYSQKRVESLLAIANVILRIRNLKTKLPEEQVVAEITSYNFLHRIRNLLSMTDYRTCRRTSSRTSWMLE